MTEHERTHAYPLDSDSQCVPPQVIVTLTVLVFTVRLRDSLAK